MEGSWVGQRARVLHKWNECILSVNNLRVDSEVDNFGPWAVVIVEGVLRSNPILAGAASMNKALEVAEPEPHVVKLHQLAEYAGARICKRSRSRKGGGIKN